MKFATSLWRGRLLTILAGVVFFALYLATVHPGFFPGDSARQTAIALRLEPCVVGTHSLQPELQTSLDDTGRRSTETKTVAVAYRTKYLVWRMVCSAVASLPVGGLAARMNLLSVVCGALCIAFAFALGRTLFLFLSFHVSALSGLARKRAALVAGAAAALALGLSAPFWIASTRCMPQPFETLLLLVMGQLLLASAIHHRELPLLFCGFILGLTVFEWDSGFFLAPALAFFIYRAMLVGEVNDAHGWTYVLAGFAIGVAGYLCLSHIMLAREGVGPLTPAIELLKSSKAVGRFLFRGGLFESQARLVSLCFAILPFVASVAMAIWRDNEKASSSGGILLFALTCTVTITLSGVSVSPWGSFRTMSPTVLPTTISLLNACVVSYLAGQGALLAGGRLVIPEKTPKKKVSLLDADTIRSTERRDHPVGRILIWYVLFISLAFGVWNYGHDVADWRDTMSDRVAARIVEELGPCTWISSGNAILDTLIRLHGYEKRHRVSIINTEDERSAATRLSRAVGRDPAFAGLPTQKLRQAITATNTSHFITTWISLDPKVDAALVLDSPDLWVAAGRPAIPAVVGYKTLPFTLVPTTNVEIVVEQPVTNTPPPVIEIPSATNEPSESVTSAVRLITELSKIDGDKTTATARDALAAAASAAQSATNAPAEPPPSAETNAPPDVSVSTNAIVEPPPVEIVKDVVPITGSLAEALLDDNTAEELAAAPIQEDAPAIVPVEEAVFVDVDPEEAAPAGEGEGTPTVVEGEEGQGEEALAAVSPALEEVEEEQPPRRSLPPPPFAEEEETDEPWEMDEEALAAVRAARKALPTKEEEPQEEEADEPAAPAEEEPAAEATEEEAPAEQPAEEPEAEPPAASAEEVREPAPAPLASPEAVEPVAEPPSAEKAPEAAAPAAEPPPAEKVPEAAEPPPAEKEPAEAAEEAPASPPAPSPDSPPGGSGAEPPSFVAPPAAITNYVTHVMDVPVYPEVDWITLADRHLLFWNDLSATPALGPHAPLWLRRNRNAIRSLLSRIGHDLGDELSRHGQSEKAKDVHEKAASIGEEPRRAAETYSSDYEYGY